MIRDLDGPPDHVTVLDLPDGPDVPDVPLCVDCVHQFQVTGFRRRCHRPISQGFSPVSGTYPIVVGTACSFERATAIRGLLRKRRHCGPDGFFFEARPAKPPRRRRTTRVPE